MFEEIIAKFKKVPKKVKKIHAIMISHINLIKIVEKNE